MSGPGQCPSGQTLAFDALEVVQNQLLLQINERNVHLKRCLANEAAQDTDAIEYTSIDFIKETEGDAISHETLVQSVQDVQILGSEALIFAIGHKNDLLTRIRVTKLENCLLIERLHCRQLKIQQLHLQQQTNRTIHELEKDPMVGNMRHSSLVTISERLLKTGTHEQRKNYLLKWNDSLRQVISDINKIELNKYLWENYDFRAKRCDLQVMLYSYETLSEGTRKIICLPLIEMENRYLTEVARRLILGLKVKWLGQRVQEG